MDENPEIRRFGNGERLYRVTVRPTDPDEKSEPRIVRAGSARRALQMVGSRAISATPYPASNRGSRIAHKLVDVLASAGGLARLVWRWMRR